MDTHLMVMYTTNTMTVCISKTSPSHAWCNYFRNLLVQNNFVGGMVTSGNA